MAKRRQGGMVFSTNSDYMTELEQAHNQEIETLDPGQQKLIVRRDNKARKGKVVTLVLDFEGSDEDLQELGKRLKVACGVGGSAKNGEIIVQGDFVERIHNLLLEWGYARTKRR